MNYAILEELEKFNNIKFDADTHAYTVDKIKLNSVTKIVGSTEFFDEIGIANKQAEKLGIPAQVIIDKWHLKGEYAKLKGTEIHSYIENRWLEKSYKFNSYEKFMEMFVELDVLKEQYDRFHGAAKNLMELVKTEFRVYDVEYLVAGTFDGLFYNKVNHCYDIWDWKTSSEINKVNAYGHKLIGLEHLDACNFNTYALQLSIYKYIIEKNTNIKIAHLNLCQLSTKNKMFNAFRLPYLKNEAVYLLEQNQKNFKK